MMAAEQHASECARTGDAGGRRAYSQERELELDTIAPKST
jgi:hypothetical protein